MRLRPPRVPWRAGPVAAGLLLLAWVPGQAQITGKVRPFDAEAASLGLVTVAIDVDMGSTGKLLGGYGATVLWDPLELDYVGDSGGGEPTFDSAVVNRTAVAGGLLAFGDASPLGEGGSFTVFTATFRALGTPLSTAALDLEFTSLFAAGTYEDLTGMLATVDGQVTVTHFPFALRPADAGGSFWEWDSVPGAVAYDLIRGETAAVNAAGGAVDLGKVVCIEDDSADTTTDAGSEPSNPDLDVPAPGSAYFYLARFHDGAANQTYGYSHTGGLLRRTSSGDCP